MLKSLQPLSFILKIAPRRPRSEINRPLAPQPSVRSVVIDNQIGMLCHDRRQSLAFTLFPCAGLANCLATIPSSAVPFCRPPSVPRGYDPPNSRQFILLQPLCSLFSTSVLCFQSLAASFAKKGGVGYTHKREAYSNSLDSNRRTPRKSRGEKEGAAGYREGDKGAGPLVAIAWTRGDTGRVQQKEPEQKHQA